MAEPVQAARVQLQQAGSEPVHVKPGPESPEPSAPWAVALRVAFRFFFVYFGLFSFSTQILPLMLPIPNLELPEFGIVWPLRQITFWTAVHVFHIMRPLVYTGSGSSDKTFDWVQVFCLLVMAGVTTAIWSVLDRRRKNYIGLHKWFRLFLRFALASEMFAYGLDKIIPVQMPFPPLAFLLESVGNFAPMGVLWWSIGASRPYEIFAGCAETLGGLLLVFPRTTTLGALVCLADMIQVFMLNMTYDVPVKLLSFHLILFSLFLLAPDFRRMATFFLFSRTIGPSTQPPLFSTLRANRFSVILQVVFALYLVAFNLYSNIQGWYTYSGGQPKPSLYGIWDVEQMSIDGQLRPPLLTDRDRWRRVIFDSPKFTQLQRLDGSFFGYGSSINDPDKTVTFTKNGDKNWKSIFTFQRPTQDHLVLDGLMDGHKIHAELKLFDRNKLTLVNRGFHWINEYPFQK